MNDHPVGAHRAQAGPTRSRSLPPSPADESTSIGWWLRTIGGWVFLLACAAILLALVVVPRVSGAQAYTVLTGSMEPTIPPGALVVVRPTAAEELRAGDVITFQPNSGDPTVVTHRIIGVFYDQTGQQGIHTQGDANNTPDDWVLVPEQVRGVEWYSVPQLGRVNLLLTGEMRVIGIGVLAGGLLVYAAWMFAGGLRDQVRERKVAGGRGGHRAVARAGGGDDDDVGP
ncbi:signal peptidase I [Dietzia sp. B32]|uniref:signal peptidase I n=1 Tax=Dietzia sp. B32 TaxID=2915130 RepID=UPI0021AD5322|nr:signal peptidase I [Dietzia sp. B32]UVE96391.1 signal peptidase I [Dietzia sp. B32]